MRDRKFITKAERETSFNVFTTWELWFEQVVGDAEEERKKAHFLTLAAFFGNKNHI